MAYCCFGAFSAAVAKFKFSTLSLSQSCSWVTVINLPNCETERVKQRPSSALHEISWSSESPKSCSKKQVSMQQQQEDDEKASSSLLQGYFILLLCGLEMKVEGSEMAAQIRAACEVYFIIPYPIPLPLVVSATPAPPKMPLSLITAVSVFRLVGLSWLNIEAEHQAADAADSLWLQTLSLRIRKQGIQTADNQRDQRWFLRTTAS
ncbi:hypothetical protein NQZ68_020461 [Dissostichus eleginoides]|nr:hypothetical protein NQZ68_020461 [Dissostichus eleginoides]